MFTFLSHAFHDSSLCVQVQQPIHSNSPVGGYNLFGDLFLPRVELEYSDLMDYLVPEFELDGLFEEAITMCSDKNQSQGSRKLSNELASTQDHDLSASDIVDTETNYTEASNSPTEPRAKLQNTSDTKSSLKKRPPSHQEDFYHQIDSKPADRFITEFDRQNFTKAQLASLVLKLIDREKLPETLVAQLDPESIQLLSNFSFMIYSSKLSADSLSKNLVALNELISSIKEKKKRNEERIKYVFKRINKILLKRFMNDSDLPQEEENKAMELILEKYFGVIEQLNTDQSCKKDKTLYERYFTLLFKPSNMYRNDLKDVFNFPSYLEVFKDILDSDFLTEFMDKRQTKIESYLNDLRNEIFYCVDKTDPTILQKKVTRLPWSVAEVQKGISLFRDVFKMH